MKLYDGGKVIAGLVVFVALVGLPLWYNTTVGESVERPQLEMPDPQQHPNCVAPVEEMRASHMDLLDEWRDAVVRDGERVYTAFDGTEYEMSLSQTCMDCHSSKENFCDRCHNYVGVTPYCWDCHDAPRGE